jgi:hypothetical protein
VKAMAKVHIKFLVAVREAVGRDSVDISALKAPRL